MTQQAEGRAAGPVLLRLDRMFLDGIGTEEDAGSAPVCFRKAESFLYDMAIGGDDNRSRFCRGTCGLQDNRKTA